MSEPLPSIRIEYTSGYRYLDKTGILAIDEWTRWMYPTGIVALIIRGACVESHDGTIETAKSWSRRNNQNTPLYVDGVLAGDLEVKPL